MYTFLENLFAIAEIYLYSLACKPFLSKDDSAHSDGCKVHPKYGNVNPSALFWSRVGEYTDRNYIRLAEEMLRIPFLTIIESAPILFQVGSSNIICCPHFDRYVRYYRATISYRPKSFMEPRGFLKIEIHEPISFEAAFEELKECDRLDMIFYMNFFKGAALR